jgi:hypothetical protein
LLVPLGGDIEWVSSRIRMRPRPTSQPLRRDASADDVAERRRVAAEGHRVGAAADAASAPAEEVGRGGFDIEISGPSAPPRIPAVNDVNDFTTLTPERGGVVAYSASTR